jgi:flagellar basal body-associated protein FliL
MNPQSKHNKLIIGLVVVAVVLAVVLIGIYLTNSKSEPVKGDTEATENVESYSVVAPDGSAETLVKALLKYSSEETKTLQSEFDGAMQETDDGGVLLLTNTQYDALF